MNAIRKNALFVVLRHLLQGGRSFQVTLKGEARKRTFVLSDDHELCQLAKNDRDEDVLLRTDIHLGPLIKLVDSLSEEDIFSIGCHTAMIEEAEEKTARRDEHMKALRRNGK